MDDLIALLRKQHRGVTPSKTLTDPLSPKQYHSLYRVFLNSLFWRESKVLGRRECERVREKEKEKKVIESIESSHCLSSPSFSRFSLSLFLSLSLTYSIGNWMTLHFVAALRIASLSLSLLLLLFPLSPFPLFLSLSLTISHFSLSLSLSLFLSLSLSLRRPRPFFSRGCTWLLEEFGERYQVNRLFRLLCWVDIQVGGWMGGWECEWV